MNLTKIVACYVAFLVAFALAVDAFGADKASTGPLGASDVTFVYGSQVPGTAPHVTVGTTRPTLIVFSAPIVIRAHVGKRRATLNHASTIVRHAYRVNASSVQTAGDLPGAPVDFAAGDACQTVGPRLDGSKVRICGGAVVAVVGPDGTVYDRPFSHVDTF